ncbi:hypothetical protein BT69DRAFT_1286740 [Atractiella rhizophila]|nr:hypothetical protein BT69DRAFT_1286740 [Atractiella rhizophila]
MAKATLNQPSSALNTTIPQPPSPSYSYKPKMSIPLQTNDGGEWTERKGEGKQDAEVMRLRGGCIPCPDGSVCYIIPCCCPCP